MYKISFKIQFKNSAEKLNWYFKIISHKRKKNQEQKRCETHRKQTANW